MTEPMHGMTIRVSIQHDTVLTVDELQVIVAAAETLRDQISDSKHFSVANAEALNSGLQKLRRILFLGAMRDE